MKKIWKLMIFVLIIGILAVGGVFVYIKTSPKLKINSANNISFYDN